MKDFRKIFFSALLPALLIISNILTVKLTVVANLPLPCSVFVYPFTFLCTIVIAEIYGGKEARKSVYSAVIVQAIIIMAIIVGCNLPNQVDTINLANSLRDILTPTFIGSYYLPDIRLILASFVGFILSELTAIGLYSFARKNTYKLVASSLAILIGLILDSVLFVFISKMGVIESNELIIQLVNRFVVDVVVTLVFIPLFAIFSIKKKEPVKEETKKKKTTKKATN